MGSDSPVDTTHTRGYGMTTKGFVHCMELDGTGGARLVDTDLGQAWNNPATTVWVHLDALDPGAEAWLRDGSGLSEIAVDTLLADDTRPRVTPMDNGVLMCLRAVNRNPGAEPDDMVALRMWTAPSKMITIRHRWVAAIEDTANLLREGRGPTTTPDLVTDLCERITDRIADVVDEVSDGVDELEDQVLEKERQSLRSRLAQYRRMLIGLRRYLVPQREAVNRLSMERLDWIDDRKKLELREVAERTARCLDDLDSCRERAAVAAEELNMRLSEQMNQTIYIMSIVATIFLPLGLLTGLLGINVGGIPGTENPWAFTIVCVGLIGVAIAEYVYFKRRNVL